MAPAVSSSCCPAALAEDSTLDTGAGPQRASDRGGTLAPTLNSVGMGMAGTVTSAGPATCYQ